MWKTEIPKTKKSNASCAAVNLSMHFYHTRDKEFARKVYPPVRAAAVFREKYLIYEDGRYVDYNGAIRYRAFNPFYCRFAPLTTNR